MADEITPVDSDESADTQFIRTTDVVQGDPPGTTGTLTGPINVALQKVMNTLLYLKNRLDNLNLTPNNASTTQRGVAEIANQSEGRTGTDAVRMMTALRVLDALRNGSAFYASTTQRGTAELATQAEVNARSDNSKIVTPATLPEPSAVPNASTTVRGIAELATQSEVNARTDNSKIVTPGYITGTLGSRKRFANDTRDCRDCEPS